MCTQGGKNWRNLTVSDGGQTERGEHRTSADLEFERAAYALLIAMEKRNGGRVDENFDNIARGHTKPFRMAMRRLQAARQARNHARNYPLAKQLVQEFDHYVDVLFGIRPKQHITGEFDPPSAPAAQVRAA